MPYDANPATIAWFERALVAECPRTRWRALELLRDTECPGRDAWLSRAENDSDPRVATTAVLVRIAIDEAVLGPGADLFESDFAEGVMDPSLEWEWEYLFVVCHDLYAPQAGWLVWTKDEDDDGARKLALLKASVGIPEPAERTPIMLGKRFVTLYTRSPRSTAEAMMWHRRGRPRFTERR